MVGKKEELSGMDSNGNGGKKKELSGMDPDGNDWYKGRTIRNGFGR